MSDLNQRVNSLSEQQRILLAQAILRTRSLTQAPDATNTRLCAFVTPTDATRTVDASAAREHLRGRLPDYMIPDSITVLKELPRLSNGKVDERALPNPQDTSDGGGRDFVTAQTASERILERIWSDLLCLDVVSMHDNFFEVGGDSITGIQMVSRAREAGLQIGPSQLNDYPTIAGLASVATAETVGDNDDRHTGDAPLTPIQHWFLSRGLIAANHWNQACAFELSDQVTAAILKDAIAVCMEHHDALRAQFRAAGHEWIQTIPDAGARLQLETVCVATFDVDEFQRQATERLGPFDLETGPLIRFAKFAFADGRPSRLLIVAHHLVMDNVSWSILTSDLARVCQQLIDQQKPSLPPKTTSFIEWAERLTTYANNNDCRESAAYWLTNAAEAAAHLLPTDHSLDGRPDEQSTATVVSTLSKQQTTALLTESNQAYNTQTNDLLLTALAITLSNWSANSAIRIDLEGHGRENVFEDADPGRTIGWFTSFFPVAITLQDIDDCASSIKAVKEQVRSIPDRGLNYGVQRYLSSDKQLIESLTDMPEAQVLFNYAGVDSGNDSGDKRATLLKKIKLDCTAARSPGNARSHLLEINAAVVNGTLSATWIFSELVHDRATIERVAGQFTQALESLVTHCSTAGTRGFTPSDVPETGLNQEELDQFLDNFE